MHVRDYFFGEEYLNYIEEKPTLQRNFADRITTLRRFSSGGRLFEIGCAYGFFLELAQRFWTVEGCDISEDGCAHAQQRQLKATCAEFLQLPVEPNSYDVVSLWDTIEHLPRPDLYIQKGAEMLSPGGLICLTTGDLGSLVARIRKDRWRLIRTPTHLYFFDRQSMERLLMTHGFEVIHFEHCGYYRSVQQILYSLLVLNHETPGRKKAYEVLKSVFGFSLYLNLYDIMFVIARKK
jgi:SAM-dependent methyltransferase